MLSVPDINRMRRRQREKSERNFSSLFGLGCALFISLLIVVSSITFALIYTDLTRNLPSLESLPALLDPPDGLLLQPTTLYDRTGEYVILKLENPAVIERLFLNLDESQTNFIPKHLVSATIATVEPGFWQNIGFSLNALDPGNQPTIAQRLASDLLFWNEQPGLRRNLRERLLAAQITTQFGQEKVLIWYLNNENYGRLTYGADAAARVYFGKPAAELSLVEAAVLAAVSEAPSLNPIDAPEAARERGNEVIHTMLAQGLITAEQAEAALETKLKFQPPTDPPSNLAPAFVNLVMEQLGEKFDINRLERGGLRVITTLDYDLQTQTACASKIQLARLEDSSGQVQTNQGEECQAARLLPSLLYNPEFSPQNLGANVVVLNPNSGEILAMVGETSAGMDPAHTPGHTPGSLLTPIIYLAGFTQGLGPASLVWDIPSILSEAQPPDEQYMGPIRLRVALANDYLMPIQQVLTQVGSEKVWRLARQLGLITAELPQGNDANAILEEGTATLLELSRAFGVFATQGILAGADLESTDDLNNNNLPKHAVTVLGMVDFHGKSWYEGNSTQLQAVISPQLAHLITNVLSDETARWPSMGHPNPLEIGRPAAAKMGRTTEMQDAWTIGYTPKLVVGVWIGHNKEQSTGQVPPKAAAALWHAIMQYASRDFSPEGWPIPAGINNISVCDPSGLLPSADCPNVVDEVFLAGYEPTQSDTLYQRLQINRETGQLATVFTPPEFIEERVYLMVPPEAIEWARQAGLPTPPDSYDVIISDLSTTPNAEISSPGMFAYVRGKVPVTGTAIGEDFYFFRLQVGPGLNPRKWLQIGDDISTPVRNEELGIWDASNLSGLYAIQLLVVDKEQHVETSTIQVTVDNQPPEVEIIYPSEGQEFVDQEDRITIQVNIIENLAIDSVDFYIDNNPIHTLRQPPFSIPWQTKPGKHTLRVVAIDQAGNEGKVIVEFIVKE